MNAPVNGLKNRTWHELKIGDQASIEKRVTARDLFLFAHASGNMNPLNIPHLDVQNEGSTSVVAPSIWIGSLISSVLGNILPGPGTLYRSQNFEFMGRAHVGDLLKIAVTLIEKRESPGAVFQTTVSDINGVCIASGTAIVDAPLENVYLGPNELPALLMGEYDHFDRLIAEAKKLDPMPTAVVCPDDAMSLAGAFLAMTEGLIKPILIGSRQKIQSAAEEAQLDISSIELIDIADHKLAAAKAVELVHQQKVTAIMKGNLHSDELLSQVVKKEGGLRTLRRISHVFVLNVASLELPLFITDAAINIAPDLPTKVDIIQNAIELARACGIVFPYVAVLSAVETVSFNIPSSMDAAILAKMADRGQITGGLVDGPLAMDNAIDVGAAKTKHLTSPVAGKAQILVVPNLEAGNMLAKELTFISHAQPAGLVLGAQVPIMLTSRADNELARLASCALAQLYHAFQLNGYSSFSLSNAKV
ncbi:enoyl-CoA hydratase [Polynucleobacter aenigmaticus]|uniref:Enoyl-CoA hydratase n=1 Tax=Polynucleobacter aenigmaticus TaxID=1743164 RepID=A0A254Q188_9BURK|nr:bifunctional enoyl-CoA hydratase/phosphate acetyltransferase [Polynucleobacter aenigmaticus]OWS70581.1 enoyl-CoA hydratase [Polynucleobacter aenigmaticus]